MLCLFLMLVFLMLGCVASVEDSAETYVRANVPPAVLSLSLSPEEPKAADALIVSYAILDMDEDPVDVWLTWRLDGEELDEASDTLAAFTAVAGQEVSLEITLSDGSVLQAGNLGVRLDAQRGSTHRR